MILFVLSFVLSTSCVEAADLVERDGGYFITGRGCGINTQIKYLNYMPSNIDDFECSFVKLNDTYEPLYEDIKGK